MSENPQDHDARHDAVADENLARAARVGEVDDAEGASPAASSDGSLADRLERLAVLHRQGFLTTAEFESAKRDELGTQASSGSSRRNSRQRAVGVGVVLCVLVVGALTYLVIGGLGSDDKKAKVTGTFEISNESYDPTNEFDDPNFKDATGGGCEGNGGYQDLNSITQVVVTDDHGKEVARTELGSGEDSIVSCDFTFSFELAKGPKYFVVAVGRRGSSQYTYDEIIKPGAISLVIGQD